MKYPSIFLNKTNYLNMKKFSFIFLISLTYSTLQAELPDDVKQIKDKVSILEGQKENLDKRFENLEKGIENKLYDFKKEADANKWILYILNGVAVLLPVYLIAFGIKKTVVQVFEEKIAKFLDNEKDKLMQLIQNQDIELMLKKEKKILFLSLNVNETNTIKQFVGKLDFKKNSYQVIDSNYNFVTLNEYNIIVINNAKDGFSSELLSQTLESVTAYNSLVVYFGKYKGVLDQYQNINFANSEFTLYARIMETLKIQYIITKNKNK